MAGIFISQYDANPLYLNPALTGMRMNELGFQDQCKLPEQNAGGNFGGPFAAAAWF